MIQPSEVCHFILSMEQFIAGGNVGELGTGFQWFPATLRAAMCYEVMRKLAGVDGCDDS